MKHLKRISLTDLSKDKMSKREQNRVLGGEDCCACPCIGVQNGASLAEAGLTESWSTGYGIGKFA